MTDNSYKTNEGEDVAKLPTEVKVTHKVCKGPFHPDGLELPADHFAPNPNNGVDGLNAQCKRCRKKVRDERRAALRIKINHANEKSNDSRRSALSVAKELQEILDSHGKPLHHSEEALYNRVQSLIDSILQT